MRAGRHVQILQGKQTSHGHVERSRPVCPQTSSATSCDLASMGVWSEVCPATQMPPNSYHNLKRKTMTLLRFLGAPPLGTAPNACAALRHGPSLALALEVCRCGTSSSVQTASSTHAVRVRALRLVVHPGDVLHHPREVVEPLVDGRPHAGLDQVGLFTDPLQRFLHLRLRCFHVGAHLRRHADEAAHMSSSMCCWMLLRCFPAHSSSSNPLGSLKTGVCWGVHGWVAVPGQRS